MSAVTRLRDVWKQVLLLLRGTVLLQKRMELHTASELEDIFIFQSKATHVFNTGGEWQSIRQWRPASSHAPSSGYLAPGGRFLLNLADQAAVVYVDLDAPEVAWRELVPTWNHNFFHRIRTHRRCSYPHSTPRPHPAPSRARIRNIGRVGDRRSTDRRDLHVARFSKAGRTRRHLRPDIGPPFFIFPYSN